MPIIYPRRFGEGKCLVAAFVPTEGRTLREIVHIGETHPNEEYPPMLINIGSGQYLRIVWQLPDMRPDEEPEILARVQEIAQEFEKELLPQTFELIIRPSSGLITMHFQAHTFV